MHLRRDGWTHPRHTGVLICFLHFGMIEYVIVGQRLLDHHQVKFVEGLEKFNIIERIGRISIADKKDFGIMFRAPFAP